MAKILIDEAVVRHALEDFVDIKYGLEKSRIWGGMDWTYNPMHPVHYLPLRDKADVQISALHQALADAALDKMADNAKGLGLTYGQPDRQALQAVGMHPAPCARHCEANAFEIAARGMRKQITELQEALDSMRGRLVAQIDTSAERVEKAAGNKHVCPPNCGTGYCSCIECLKGTP